MNVSSFELKLMEQVNKAQSGDKNAFAELMQNTSSAVHSIALAMTKDLDAAQDISQQVFLKVWQDLATLKSSHSFLPWLRQITRNTALNFMREHKRSSYIFEDELQTRLQELVADPYSQELTLLKSEQQRLIHTLVNNLPDESTEVVILYYREEQNSKTVATLLGITDTTVRKRLQRARDMLKEQVLAKYGQILLSAAPISTASLPSLTASSTSTTASLGIKSGWFSKASFIFSGAFLGGLLALMANAIATRCTAALCHEEQTKQAVQQTGMLSSISIAACSLLMILGYILTQGWLIPVTAYVFLAITLTIKQYKIHQLLYQNNQANIKGQILGASGLVLGMISGAVGLFYGLLNSGRFTSLL
ncbi:RNA polymerase sigma factor [Pseudoalteromonas byunsanensis]|uniref:RNA polymerase subunit sigma-70 n=1 Tax=Pseudoalteromonas byunsanensis TaxID=327939 RepID=A0A1S1NDG2_9GAMM|nr:RNA polymerase sigma factor [Pseudoalteromonas byunsanensis]OHU97869.1 hypothetical protein BIW53_00390 [Pseudoalteromonas byunsanensis]